MAQIFGIGDDARFTAITTNAESIAQKSKGSPRTIRARGALLSTYELRSLGKRRHEVLVVINVDEELLRLNPLGHLSKDLL